MKNKCAEIRATLARAENDKELETVINVAFCYGQDDILDDLQKAKMLKEA